MPPQFLLFPKKYVGTLIEEEGYTGESSGHPYSGSIVREFLSAEFSSATLELEEAEENCLLLTEPPLLLICPQNHMFCV